MKTLIYFIFGVFTALSVGSVWNLYQTTNNPAVGAVAPLFFPNASNLPEWAIPGITDGCAEWSSNVLTTAGAPCGTGSGGGAWSTSTDLVDTYVTYATGVNTIGAESTFTYDDATDLLTVGSLTTTATATLASLIVDSGIANATSTIYSNYGKINLGSSTLETLLFDFTGTNQVTLSSLSGVTDFIFEGMDFVISSANQIIAKIGGTDRIVAEAEQPLFSVTIASTSPAFVSGEQTPVARHVHKARELTQFQCWVSGGTSKVLLVTDGTNDTESVTCGATLTEDTDVATNDTFTADELWYIEAGATSGSVDYVTIEVLGYINE